MSRNLLHSSASSSVKDLHKAKKKTLFKTFEKVEQARLGEF